MSLVERRKQLELERKRKAQLLADYIESDLEKKKSAERGKEIAALKAKRFEALEKGKVPHSNGQFVAGDKCMFFLDAVGNVYGAGLLPDGKGNKKDADSLVPISHVKNVKRITCGSNVALFLTTEGNLFRWNVEIEPKPQKVDIQSQVDELWAGTGLWVATLKDGKMIFGYYQDRHNWNRLEEDIAEKKGPHVVKQTWTKGTKVQDVACGSQHFLILLTNGEVWSMGDNTYNQLGMQNAQRKVLNRVPLKSKVLKIACGANHSVALCQNGEVRCWGCNVDGRCGFEKCTYPILPRVVQLPGILKSPMNVACGRYHTVVLYQNGKVVTFGTTKYGECGIGTTDYCVPPTVLKLRHVDAVQCGDRSTFLRVGRQWYLCGQDPTRISSPKEKKIVSSPTRFPQPSHMPFFVSKAFQCNGYYYWLVNDQLLASRKPLENAMRYIGQKPIERVWIRARHLLVRFEGGEVRGLKLRNDCELK